MRAVDRTINRMGSAWRVKRFLATICATFAAIAQPALAQNIAGSVNLTGSVAPRCGIASSGSGVILGQTVALGELAAANGTLRTGLDNQFANAVAPVSVVCNAVAPTVSVTATPLVAQSSTATPPSGYANTIAYTATVTVATTGAAAVAVSAASGTSVTHTLTSGEGRIAGSAGNVVLTATGFHTADPAQILVADTSYQGNIAVTIAPGA